MFTAHFFAGLTPEHFSYFAGHYRGEPLRCLNNYEVGIDGDTSVGHTAATVPAEMEAFGSRLRYALLLVDMQMALPSAGLPPAVKMIVLAQVVAALFVEFLEIHPYANGNGHMSRLIVLTLLGKHNYYPRREWTIDPRPSDPRYPNLIMQYRSGTRDPLVQYIIECL